LKLTVLTLCTSSSENLNTICKLVKRGHAEAWKILYDYSLYQQSSGFFQVLKLTEYFRSE